MGKKGGKRKGKCVAKVEMEEEASIPSVPKASKDSPPAKKKQPKGVSSPEVHIQPIEEVKEEIKVEDPIKEEVKEEDPIKEEVKEDRVKEETKENMNISTIKDIEEEYKEPMGPRTPLNLSDFQLTPKSPLSETSESSLDNPITPREAEYTIARMPAHKSKFKEVKLCTNYFSIDCHTSKYISVSAIEIVPEITSHNPGMVRRLIREAHIQITKHIGNYFLRGMNLFSMKTDKDNKIAFLVQVQIPGAGVGVGNSGAGNPGAGNPGAGNPGAGNPGAGNPGAGNSGAGNSGAGNSGAGNPGNPVTTEKEEPNIYNINITERRVIDLGEICNPESKGAQVARMFFGNIVKELMRAQGMMSIGRTQRYFSSNSGFKIPQHGVEVWQGFQTSVHFTTRGLLLEVDFASRVLRTETLFQTINDIMGGGYEGDMETVKEELKGKSFLAGYGHKKTYKIDDILFDRSPTSQKVLYDGKMVTLVEYYARAYNIKLQYPNNQPLLLSYHVFRERERKGKVVTKKKESLHFIPELCYMTGLSDKMVADHRIMGDIATYTKLTPSERMKKITHFINSFSREDIKDGHGRLALEQPGAIKNMWGLDFAKNPISIKGNQLDPVVIKAHEGVELSNKGVFFLKKKIRSPILFDNWICAYNSRNFEVAEQLLDGLQKAGGTFGITFKEPRWIEYNGNYVEHIIEPLVSKVGECKPQIVVFLLPPAQKYFYSELKVACNDLAVLSQVVMTRTVSKGLSALGKIAIQINAKNNGSPWVFIKPPHIKIPQFTMCIGIDVSREGGRTVLGFASSISPDFDKYMVQTEKLMMNQEIADTLQVFTLNALNKFRSVTPKPHLPEYIIVYRDGVGESQKEMLFRLEFESIMAGIKELEAGYSPKVTYATINKKINSRVFVEGDARGYGVRGLKNLQPGVVISGEILEGRKYEFLLMPHFVDQGTGTPTLITVLYDSSTLSVDDFAQLTNCMCYIYFNWMGPIRTPACCKYAEAAAKHRAKYVPKISKLNDNLYYL